MPSLCQPWPGTLCFLPCILHPLLIPSRCPSLHQSCAELIAESASTALGGVAAGNLSAYLPLLLQHVHAQANSPKQLYQLLKVGAGCVWGAGGVSLQVLPCAPCAIVPGALPASTSRGEMFSIGHSRRLPSSRFASRLPLCL